MVKISDVTFGAPCWMDLTTDDVEGAKAFYGELFGWTAVDYGAEMGHYHSLSKGDSAIAGLSGKSAEMGNADAPNAWGIYFAVENAEATAKAISENGGQVLFPVMDVPGQGHMSIAIDPTGAAFGIWQPLSHRGFQEAEVPGTPGWFELSTRNFDAAVMFYTSVFGVQIADMPGNPPEAADGMPAYQVIMIDGQPRAGLIDGSTVLRDGVPSSWIIYFVVDDTDAAVSKATELGGSVQMGPEDSTYGRFAVVADPSGATFAVISGDSPE